MNAFEISTLKTLDMNLLGGARLLLAVSGGRDSIALLESFYQISKKRQITLFVAHVHHGLSENPESATFRNEALRIVEEEARSRGLEFLSVKHSGEVLRGEAELRRFRHSQLEELRILHRCDCVVFAHHRDDLLETRFMRLLRGVGPQGLRSMKERMGFKFRPFLQISAAEITEYVREKKLRWLDDPSNRDESLLRNWVRHSLFPKIETRRPGSVEGLARSLENLSRGAKFPYSEYVDGTGIRRSRLLELDKKAQRRVLAHYLRAKGFKEYSVSHIDEILKRLDSSRHDLIFNCLKKKWVVDTQHIRVES